MASKKRTSKQPAAEEFLYFGLGLASLAKDQLQTVASALVKEGKLLAKDRQKLKKDLTTKGQGLYKSMQGEMEKATAALLKKMDIPSRKEFETLKRQVASKRASKK